MQILKNEKIVNSHRMVLEFPKDVTEFPKDVISFIFSFIPKAMFYSCLNKRINHILTTSTTFKRLWTERNIIRSKGLDLIWCGDRGWYYSYAKRFFKDKIFCHRYKDEKYIIPYSGIYSEYYKGYLEESIIYENGKRIIRVDRDIIIHFFHKNYEPLQRKCKCKYHWVKTDVMKKDEISHTEAYPIRTESRCDNIACKYSLKDEIRLKWNDNEDNINRDDINHDVINNDKAYIDLDVINEMLHENDESFESPKSYKVIINSGKKIYKVYRQLNINTNEIEEEIYKIKRKNIGKKIKCVKSDGTIVRRTRMQETKTIETKIPKFKFHLEIPKRELFSNITNLYNIIYYKKNEDDEVYLPKLIHEELLNKTFC